MILCEWDASEGHPGQSCVHLYARILSTSFTSVLIFSVCCYSIVSISVGWPLLTDVTEVNGDSKSTNESGPPSMVGLLGLSCRYKRFLSCLAALVSPVQNIFIPHRTLFQLFYPHSPTSWAGSRAGSPVSKDVSLAPSAGKTVNFCIFSLKNTKIYKRKYLENHHTISTRCGWITIH
jgi:hypothetical protein